MVHTDADSQNSTRTAYDRLSSFYDDLADSSEHVAREAGQRALDVKPGEAVLEIGYGPGRALAFFAAQVGPRGKVRGIDLSPGMAKVARQTLEAANIQLEVSLDVGDARKLPYDDDSFDAAFMSFTLELFELEQIPIALAELKRVLRPGGRLGVVSMSTSDHDNTMTKIYKWFHRHFPHFVDCQPINSAMFLEQAGFEISSRADQEIWSLPVSILVGVKQA